jgi:hypothetical protein
MLIEGEVEGVSSREQCVQLLCSAVGAGTESSFGCGHPGSIVSRTGEMLLVLIMATQQRLNI